MTGLKRQRKEGVKRPRGSGERRAGRHRILTAVLALALIFSLTPGAGMVALGEEPPAAAPSLEDYTLTVDYDMTMEDAKLVDKAGDFDAPLVGLTAANFSNVEGDDILTFPNSNGDRYAKIPDGVIQDENFAVEVKYTVDRANTNAMLWGFGTRRADLNARLTNFLNFHPNVNNALRLAVKDTSLAGEKSLSGGTPGGADFTTALVLFREGDVSLYQDGTLVGTIESGYSIQDILKSGIANYSDAIGYIGRAMVSRSTANDNFRGTLTSFRIYNKTLTDQDILDKGYDGLTIPGADNVRGNVTLPEDTRLGVQISWESSDPALVSDAPVANADYDDTPAGVVTRPADEDRDVTLTATLNYKGLTRIKTFPLTVKKKAAPVNANHYLFTHFTGSEGSASAEQVYFAASKDGLNFSDLNDTNPVLVSNIGEKGVRDMCTIRSAEGDRFFLIATDLSVYYRGGWNSNGLATVTGSQKIVVWESDDLVNWSEPRLVHVAPEGAGNSWAPEAFYDEKTGEYIVFYASVTNSQNKIYYCKTRDFWTFTEAKIYIPNVNTTSTIDTAIMEEGDYYYRSSRIGENSNCYQRVDRVSKADGLLGEWDITSLGSMEAAVGLPVGRLEGPEFYKLGDSAGENAGKWIIMADQFAQGLGYLPVLMSDPGDPATWTQMTDYNFGFLKKRHGNILPITEGEYKAVIEKYGIIDITAPAPEAGKTIASFDFNTEAVEGVYDGGPAKGIINGDSVLQVKDAENPDDKALYLDGTGDFLRLTKQDDSSLLAGLEEFTVSYDAKAARISTNWPFYAAPTAGTQSGGSETYIGLFESGNNTTAERFRSGRESGASARTGTDWVHVEVVYKKAATYIYVNGALKGYAKSSFPIPSILGQTPITQIGKANWGPNGEFHRGHIDNFKIYTHKEYIPQAGLLADYAFGQRPDDGATVANQAADTTFGDAVVQNPASATWSDEAIVFSSTNTSGNPTGAWVLLPNDLLSGKTSGTVSIEVRAHPNILTQNHFLWNMGSSSTNQYWFANTMAPRTSITSSGSGGERTATSPVKMTADRWYNLTAVVDGEADTISFYMDGKKMATTAANGRTPALITSQTRNAIARSPYTGDRLFRGAVANFHVYDRALTDAEILKISDVDAASHEDGFTAIAQSLLEGISAFDIKDAVMTLEGLGGQLTWKSGDARIAIGEDGVTATTQLPAPGTPDFTATLTATANVRGKTVSKNVTVTVVAPLTDAERVENDMALLAIENADNMRGNFSLPAKGLYGSDISWTVKEPGTASPVIVNGVKDTSKTVQVTRPEYDQEPTTVVLTATVTMDSPAPRAVSMTKDFEIIVIPKPNAAIQPEGYVWAFFTGEGVGAERISLSASDGNNALDWITLNNGEPIITSTKGTGGLRDPFIIRSRDGDKFYMLATDLKVAGLSGGFTTAQRTGSTYMEVWESEDLVNWSEQRHVKVSTDYAGNTWAPEAYYDDGLGKYVVYWASNLYPTPNGADRTSLTYNRMMYVTTDDFITFSEPQIWIDVQRGNGTDGKGCIDVTMQKLGDTFYRVYKDENSMTLRMEKSKDLYAPVAGSMPTATGAEDQWTLIKAGICGGLPNGFGGTFSGGEGPSLFKANAGDVNGLDWYLFMDQPNYHGGPNHYIPFGSSTLADGDSWQPLGTSTTLPQNSDGGKPRHGTIIPVTRSEHLTVLQALGPDPVPATGIQLDQDLVALEVDETVTLKATVTPENATNKYVNWESSDLSVATVDANGKVTATGEGGALITATTVDGGLTAYCGIYVELAPLPADRSQLAWFMENALSLIGGTHNYIPISVTNLQEVLDAARIVYDDEDATQEELDAAAETVVGAIKQLYEKGKKAGLQTFVNLMNIMKEANYTETSWAGFAEALEQAKTVLANENAVQEHVDKAYSDLTLAYSALTRMADMRGLQSAVDQAKKILDAIDDYVPSTVLGLAAAYSDADAVLKNKNSTQAQVDAARTALNTLLTKVRLKPDKSPLLDAMSKVKAMNLSLYTSASVKALDALVAKGASLLAAGDENLVQSEINALASGINQAIQGLVLKETAKAEKAKAASPAKDKKTAARAATGKKSPEGTSSTRAAAKQDAVTGSAPAAAAGTGTNTAPEKKAGDVEQQAASDPRSAAVATGGEGGGMQDSAVPKDAGEKQGGLSPMVLILTALILAAFGCLIGYTRARAGRTKKNTAA